MKTLLAPTAFLCVVFVSACSGSGGDGGASSPTPTPTAVANPVFETDILPILNQSCGTTDNACHSRVAYGASSAENCRGWLSLEDAAIGAQFYAGPDAGNSTGCPDRPLYERLTAAGLSNSWECGPPAATGDLVPYVLPGDAAGSYLYRKIAGGPYCNTPSDPMPPGAPLSADKIQTIANWINAGAPRAQ